MLEDKLMGFFNWFKFWKSSGDSPRDPSRRRFLKDVAKVGAGALAYQAIKPLEALSSPLLNFSGASIKYPPGIEETTLRDENFFPFCFKVYKNWFIKGEYIFFAQLVTCLNPNEDRSQNSPIVPYQTLKGGYGDICEADINIKSREPAYWVMLMLADSINTGYNNSSFFRPVVDYTKSLARAHKLFNSSVFEFADGLKYFNDYWIPAVREDDSRISYLYIEGCRSIEKSHNIERPLLTSFFRSLSQFDSPKNHLFKDAKTLASNYIALSLSGRQEFIKDTIVPFFKDLSPASPKGKDYMERVWASWALWALNTHYGYLSSYNIKELEDYALGNVNYTYDDIEKPFARSKKNRKLIEIRGPPYFFDKNFYF